MRSKGIGIAIVGGGQGCLDLLTLFDHFKLKEFKPHVIGVADINDNAVGITYAKKLGLITTTDFKNFYSNPEIELIIEVTGSNQVLDEIISTKPLGLKLIDHVVARIFWDLIRLKENDICNNVLESNRDAYIVINSGNFITHFNKTAKNLFKNECNIGVDAKTLLCSAFGEKSLALLDRSSLNSLYGINAYQGTDYELPVEIARFKTHIEDEDCFVLSIRDMSRIKKVEYEVSRLKSLEELFNMVAAEFALSKDLDESIKYTAGLLGQTLRVDRVTIWQLDSRNKSVCVYYKWQNPDIQSYFNVSINLKQYQLPFIWEQLMQGIVIKINNVLSLPEPDQSILSQMGLKAVLGTPLKNKALR